MQSNCVTFDGVAKLLISDLDGTETVTNEGTAVATVGAGEITFTAGTCWNLKISNGAEYACAEGGLSDTLYNIGTAGVDALFANANLADVWADTQDVYHYNFLNGFDLWENGNAGEEIRVPIGANVTQAGYFQAGTTNYLDENMNGGLTENSQLEWENGSIRNFTVTENGTSTVTEVGGGTRIYCPDGISIGITLNSDPIVVGKTYKVLVDIHIDILGKGLYLYAGGETTIIDTEGVSLHTFTASADSIFKVGRNYGTTDITIYSLYVWEEGTVPNLSPTNPAGKWHNNAETKIQLPATLSSIQDITPISSITDNKFLEWENGTVRGFITHASGTSTLTEESNGTRFYSPDGDSCYTTKLTNIENGKTYNYLIVIVETSGAGVKLVMGGTYKKFDTVGEHTGTITATADSTTIELNRYGATDTTVAKLYVWEENTVPPLSYLEFELDFNNAHRVFSNREDKKHKYLVAYDKELTTEERLKLQKCLKQSNSDNLLYADDGVTILTDDDGVYLTK